jgi:hypothetical protein
MVIAAMAAPRVAVGSIMPVVSIMPVMMPVVGFDHHTGAIAGAAVVSSRSHIAARRRQHDEQQPASRQICPNLFDFHIHGTFSLLFDSCILITGLLASFS